MLHIEKTTIPLQQVDIFKITPTGRSQKTDHKQKHSVFSSTLERNIS